MDRIAAFVEFIFDSVFSEVFAVSFLIGLVIFLLGFLFVGLFLVSRILGVRTTGTVVGAVNKTRTKTKEHNGERVEKIKSSLYPVYEYIASDGTQRQMRGSEGGSMTLKYETGQAVNLIVREDDEYDDVYDADQFGALYLGLGFLCFGAIMMAWVGDFAAAFGVGFTSILVFGLGYVSRGIIHMRDKPKQTEMKRAKYTKSFDPALLQPIEHFQSPG